MFEERIYGIPWSILAVFALAVAVVYAVVDMGAGTNGLRWLLVRWGHPGAWVLLGLAALAMTKLTPLPAGWAGPIAAAGGAVYLAFLAASFAGR